jgi:hypothetical protein
MTPQELWEEVVRQNGLSGDFADEGITYAQSRIDALTAERDRLSAALQEIIELAGVVSHDMRDLDMAAIAMRALEAKP